MPETVLFNGVRVEVAPPLPAVEVAAPVATVEVEPPTPRVKVQRPVPLVGVPVTTPDPSVLVAPMRGPEGPAGPEGPQGPAGEGGGVAIDDATTTTTTTWSSSKISGDLGGKAESAHGHDYAPSVHDHDARYYTETEVDAALSGKAATSHGHAVGDVTNLQTSLDGKAATAHTHPIGDLPTDATNPAVLGTPAPGSAATVARRDHVHAMPTAAQVGAAPTAHNHAAGDVNSGVFILGRLPVAPSGFTSSTQVVRADDSRLSDARTPTTHTHTRSQITDAGSAIGYNVSATGDAAAGEVVLGSDSRLANARAWRVLGSATYAPATLAVTSTTSTVFVDVDATNLAVTFTAPASGAVDVRLEGMSDMQTGGHIGSWNLRDGVADVAGTARAMTRTNFSITLQTTIRVTGLTPGASYTYKWGYKTNNAAGYHRLLHGAEYGTSVMEVRAA